VRSDCTAAARAIARDDVRHSQQDACALRRNVASLSDGSGGVRVKPRETLEMDDREEAVEV
jgi:hypothetical protein